MIQAARPLGSFPRGLRATAVLRLRRNEALAPKAIAIRLGLTIKSVESILCRAKYAQSRSTVQFPTEVMGALVPHAARRGVSVSALVRRLVEAAGYGDAVDALLDDGSAQ